MIALAWMTALVLAAPQIPSDAQVVAHVKRLPCHRIDPQPGSDRRAATLVCRKGALDVPAVTSVSVYDKRPGQIHIEETPLGNLPALLGNISR